MSALERSPDSRQASRHVTDMGIIRSPDCCGRTRLHQQSRPDYLNLSVSSFPAKVHVAQCPLWGGQNRKSSTRAYVFRCSSNRGHCQDTSACPFGATTGLMHRSKRQSYSMTRSAIASRFGGISIASAFAVLRLITSWNLVGCSIGKSAGLAPFNILLTRTAAVRKTSS
jgi:hypothetical protein